MCFELSVHAVFPRYLHFIEPRGVQAGQTPVTDLVLASLIMPCPLEPSLTTSELDEWYLFMPCQTIVCCLPRTCPTWVILHML